jgi:hypothetical protein
MKWYIKKINIEKVGSWMTVFGFPLVILAGLVGYFQLSDYLVRADLQMDFKYLGNPKIPQYALVNESKRTAEEPYYGFVIRDLSEPEPNILPIPFDTSIFIKPGQKQGYTSLLKEYLQVGHEYIGTVMVTCRNCESTRRYFVYVNASKADESFYFPLKDKEDLISKFNQFPNLTVFPLEGRIKLNI